ncbi:Glutamine amidotransferase, class I [hydrothermal vent metagenome]|uniref:Glutamine amidotransferase, class I n=1 Tax=hydrothermal vent metagenome TaxID=652676 RepID=A0A3B0Z7B6_9ZZZZ
MIIGILQTDLVKPEFSQLFGEYPSMFQSLLQNIEPRMQFSVYDVRHNVYPDDIHECDAYLITGSRTSVYQPDPWIGVLQEFIITLDQQQKKLVAVCFGHQLVAQTFGGKTEKSNKGWGVGVHTCQVSKHKCWMKPPMHRYRLIVSHQDQVTKLPDDAELLAGSEFCPISLFQRGDNILAIQGHPEFNKAYAQALMQHRQQLLGEPLFNQGIRSLQSPTDTTDIAKWMSAFMVSAYQA